VKTNTKETQTLGPIDRILEIIFDQNTPEIKTLVTHRFPDDDGWLCFWIAKKFIPKTVNAKLVFVNAGETLPGLEDNPSVLHFDTGKGKYDQHGKNLKRTCSAAILAEKLGILDNPGLRPLLEMATAVDSAEKLPDRDLHFLIEGYPRLYQNGNINWEKVQERIFEDFEVIYGQETQRVEGRKNLELFAERTTLSNGLKVTSILWHPELREAAFEDGAAVVIWTLTRGGKRFYTGIQRNRNYSKLRLDGVAAALRHAEAGARGIDVRGKDLLYIDRQGPVTSWYLHDSLTLILNGSRSWRPKDDEYTKLVPRQIIGIVHRTLSFISREVVSQWKK